MRCSYFFLDTMIVIFFANLVLIAMAWVPFEYHFIILSVSFYLSIITFLHDLHAVSISLRCNISINGLSQGVT